MAETKNITEHSLAEVSQLVREYRATCLWFLDERFEPTTPEAALRALTYIERYGDRQAYRKAVELKSWLSQNSNAKSVV